MRSPIAAVNILSTPAECLLAPAGINFTMHGCDKYRLRARIISSATASVLRTLRHPEQNPLPIFCVRSLAYLGQPALVPALNSEAPASRSRAAADSPLAVPPSAGERPTLGAHSLRSRPGFASLWSPSHPPPSPSVDRRAHFGRPHPPLRDHRHSNGCRAYHRALYA